MLKWLFLMWLTMLPLTRAELPGKKLWKGNAILGTEDICFVYSDDPRLIQKEKSTGIKHLYYRDYTVDYLSASAFSLVQGESVVSPVVPDSISLAHDCVATTIRNYKDGNVRLEAYGAPHQTVVIRCSASKGLSGHAFDFTVQLRKQFTSSRVTALTRLISQGKQAMATWSNNISALFSAAGTTTITTTDSSVSFRGTFTPGKKTVEFRITFGDDTALLKKQVAALGNKSTYGPALRMAKTWLAAGLAPAKGKTAEENVLFSYYQRTLLATKAACLRGQIPADMTGQFITDNMPQLYPRDAMKSARVLLATGHISEPEAIIKFWCSEKIPHKSAGEFYARYDAYAHAVDGGSGARFDEPEWDANGYLIQLLNSFHEKTGRWLADKKFIYSLADFLCTHLDNEGLLYEGGIVEWTGYLPATNMICEAGLETAAKLAGVFGDKQNAERYSKAAATIMKNLPKMIDPKRGMLADVRFHGGKTQDGHSLSEKTTDRLFLWDVTTQFAPLWGFTNLDIIQPSVTFFEKNCTKLDGGLQYFEAFDPGISGYGGDVFFFTSASMAQYYCQAGTPAKALPLLRWMVKNANSYGLMPERIYLDNSDCSDASPLSWCNAEFALAIYTYSKSNR